MFTTLRGAFSSGPMKENLWSMVPEIILVVLTHSTPFLDGFWIKTGDIGHLPEVNNDLPDYQGHIVCYCSVGWRSSLLARRLKAAIKARNLALDVHNLEGSIFKWANEGKPMVDGAGNNTSSAHPFNTVFGWLLDQDRRNWPPTRSEQ